MIGTKLYKPVNRQEYAELAVWSNNNNAHIEDKGEYFECVANPEPTAQELIEKEVSDLKRYLEETDYAVVKCYDRGLVFREEYPELYTQRQNARDRINELSN